MKYLGLITAFCVAMMLVACGDDDSSAKAGKSEAANAKPRIELPSGPPPKELVVEDLREGSGPAAKAGDELKVQFVAIDQSGQLKYDTWNDIPVTFELGSKVYGPAWDRGVTGMKAGGRRQLSVPDRLSYGAGTFYYVVEVLSIKPASKPSDG